MFVAKCSKSCVDLGVRTGIDGLNLQPEGWGGLLHVAHRILCDENVSGVDEYSNTNGLGNQLMQQPQPLCHDLLEEEIDASRVAARPSEAGHKTKPDRIVADTENNWDCRGCSLGRNRRHVARRGDDSHLAPDQIGHQLRQTIVLSLQPVVLD